MRAVWKGTDYALTHSAEDIAKLVAPYFDGTSNDLLVKAITNYKIYDVWTTTPVTDKAAFERIQDIMENAKQLSSRVKYNTIVDNTYANKIGK